MGIHERKKGVTCLCCSFNYFQGNGVPKDNAEALKWKRKARDQGNVEAQYPLGVEYQNGLGVPRDYAEAVKWYRKAVDQGDATAQFNLGKISSDGRGVPQDYAEAMKWYRRAAGQGHASAQNNLGLMYGLGEGVLQDYGLCAPSIHVIGDWKSGNFGPLLLCSFEVRALLAEPIKAELATDFAFNFLSDASRVVAG